MFKIHIDEVGDTVIIECAGRLVRSDAAFALRNAVITQSEARIIVVDLTGVTAIEGGGLGMLVFLQGWSRDHGEGTGGAPVSDDRGSRLCRNGGNVKPRRLESR